MAYSKREVGYSMDIAFLITTCNRPRSCQALVDALQGQGDIYVLNDGCNYTIRGANQVKRLMHYGRAGYWRTVNQVFSLRGKHKYFIMLPDDFLPAPNMVDIAICTWKLIDDEKKICLNLYTDRTGRLCWTEFPPIDLDYVYKTQWVDMCFLCEESFFTALGVLPQTNTKHSSGVGQYISHTLHDKGFSLYQVKESLITIQPEHYKSQIHDNSRHSNTKRKGKPLPRGNFKRLLPGR